MAVLWWIAVLNHSIGAGLLTALLFVLLYTCYNEYFTEQGRQQRANSVRRRQLRKNNAAVHSRLVMASVLFVGFVYLFMLLWFLCLLLFGNSFASCAVSVHILAPMFQFTKPVMYFIFLQRVYSVYYGSQFEYSITRLGIFYALLFAVNIVIIVFDTWLPDVRERVYSGNRKICIAIVPAWFGGMAVLVDLLASAVCLWLFIRPLITLVRNQNDSSTPQSRSGRKATVKMSKVGTKYLILSTLAVISTIAHLAVVIALYQPFLGPLDMVVNLCVFAGFTNWFDDWFYGYCQWTFVFVRCCFGISMLDRIQSRGDLSSTNETTLTRDGSSLDGRRSPYTDVTLHSPQFEFNASSDGIVKNGKLKVPSLGMQVINPSDSL